MINDDNKHSWCVNACHAMSGMNDGTTKICCMHSAEEHKMLLGKDRISEIFQKNEFLDIRKSLQKGIRHKGCKLCWEEEDAGRKSKRLRDNERYFYEVETKDRELYQGIAKLELNLGNTCNIKCRTCRPNISSTWMKEHYDLHESNNFDSYKDYASQMKKYHRTYDIDSPFWEDLKNNLKTIKQFDFYGGEPFMSKKMWEILNICVERGYAKDIELHYNTNGTLWPKEIEIWKHFKRVNLSFSIDGKEDKFEYLRYPAKWSIVKKNMKKAQQLKNANQNMHISWCITLSSINIFYLQDTLDAYYEDFSDFGVFLNLVHYPTHFNISKLPTGVKEAIIDKLNSINDPKQAILHQIPGIIGFISNGNYDKKDWENFLNYTNIHDTYRNQDFYNIFKEYGEIINRIIQENK